MARVYTFYVGVLAGLVLCKYSEAGWNTTEGSTANETACDHHSSGDNCTDTDNWNGHFSTCPEKLTHYCIHGECRYIKEMDVVSCRCHPGFVGARCEFIDFSPRREEKKYIILICAVVGLLLVIVVILIVFLHRKCNLCHKKSRSRNESRNGAEKNHEDTNLKLIADSAEQPNRTNSV